MKTAIACALIGFGIGLAGWSIWATFERVGVRAWVAAVAAPVGVAMALLGAVLIFVPGFFG
jgi:hypothetical protein